MAELKIKADSGGGTVSLKGPATTTSNAAVQLTLPVDDGTANQYLKTDGSGALSWATVDTSIADDSITEAKLDIHAAPSGTDKYLAYTSNGMEWAAVAAGGITHIDTWVLTTNFSGNGNLITSNLARSTAAQMSQLGTGVTESSGVFTLPTTGHWLIIFRCHIVITGTNDEAHYEGGIRISTDSGSNFTLEAENKANIRQSDAARHGSTLTTYVMDCTNTSTQKIGFDVRTNNSNTITGGHTDYDATYMRFIRLADT